MVDMLASEKQRREHPETARVRTSIDAHIDFLGTQIAEMDQAIATQIRSDGALQHRVELLTTIPGIGQTTAAVLGFLAGHARA